MDKWIYEYLPQITAILIIPLCIKLIDRFSHTRRATRALLQDRLTQAYTFFYGKQSIPVHELENILEMHKEYKALGGNGHVDGLVNRIKSLPTNDL